MLNIYANRFSSEYVPEDALRATIASRLYAEDGCTIVTGRFQVPFGVEHITEILDTFSRVLPGDYLARVIQPKDYRYPIVMLTLFLPPFEDSEWGRCDGMGCGTSDDVMYVWGKMFYQEDPERGFHLTVPGSLDYLPVTSDALRNEMTELYTELYTDDDDLGLAAAIGWIDD